MRRSLVALCVWGRYAGRACINALRKVRSGAWPGRPFPSFRSSSKAQKEEKRRAGSRWAHG
jgi:hypothetical protein